MDKATLKSYFVEGASVLDTFAEFFTLCLQHSETLRRLKLFDDQRLGLAYDWIKDWISGLNGRQYLTYPDTLPILAYIDESVYNFKSGLIFADAFIRVVDLTYDYLAGDPIPLKDGYIVQKHSADFPQLLTNAAKRLNYRIMRSKKNLWPAHFPKHLLHLHFIPRKWNLDSSIYIHSLPGILLTQWSEEKAFRIGLSQIHAEPEFRWGGSSPYGVRFQVPDCKEPERQYYKICEETEAAFKQNVSVLLFPELVFPPQKEEKYLNWLRDKSYDYRRHLVVIIGYLHIRSNDGGYKNIVKCIVPSVNQDTQMIEYKILCCEAKKQPVNFVKYEKGLKLMSETAYEEGAIEDIAPGGGWNIIETPLGRMAFVICKDFLGLERHFIEALEIDLLFVSAMTPKMSGKFEDQARNFRNLHLTTVVIANNGWFAEINEREQKGYSYATAPLLENGQPYVRAFDRKPGQSPTLELFYL